MCTIGSVLLLDEPYHGFYIHGQTVHEHADTSMEEMREQLLKEQVPTVFMSSNVGSSCKAGGLVCLLVVMW
jgi:hypothetical protein